MMIQRLRRRRLPALLAWVGLFICLVSASSIHHHQHGVHLLNTSCMLCSLEKVTAHGFTVDSSPMPNYTQQSAIPVSALQARQILHLALVTHIRGSPLHS